MQNEKKGNFAKKWLAISILLLILTFVGGGAYLVITTISSEKSCEVNYINIEGEPVSFNSTYSSMEYELTFFCSSESALDEINIEVVVSATDGYFNRTENLHYSDFFTSFQEVSKGIYKATLEDSYYWAKSRTVTYEILSIEYYFDSELQSNKTMTQISMDEAIEKASEIAESSDLSGFESIFPIVLGVLFLNVFISAVFTAKNGLLNNDSKSNSEIEGVFNSPTKTNSCDNVCVEEGNDIFAEKRESGKVAFRDTKKANNQKRNNGKRYCRHCGAELLYNDDKCDWCGEEQ